MASIIAQVEPLPLVPPTVMTGQSSFRPSASRTRATLSSPMSMAFGCRDSRVESQSARLLGMLFMKAYLETGVELKRPGPANRTGPAKRLLSGQDVGRLVLQQRQQPGDFLAHLAAVDNHVHGALLHQEFGALE